MVKKSHAQTRKMKTLADLAKFMKVFAGSLEGSEIILLVGSLGAGKSEFVKALVAALGGKMTASPTFALHHHYGTPQFHVDHYDLYRLESEEDLESTGFWDSIADARGVVAVEWADRLDVSVWPQSRKKIEIQIVLLSSGEREFKIIR